MTVSLPSLLFRVRSTVAEISTANMDDLTMFREVQKAQNFVNHIKLTTAPDGEVETAIVCLAAYYSHVNYTLLNARQLGTIDESVLIRQNELRRIARAMLQTISSVQIAPDLSVDDSRFREMGGIGFEPTHGVLNDTLF
jgi:hypothetical protein